MVQISDNRRLFEIAAVILTGICKILFMNILQLHAVYIISAMVFWTTYLVLRIYNYPALLQYWGLTNKNLGSTFKIIGLVGGIAILLFVLYGLYFQTLTFSKNLLIVLIAYPFWGVVQQFITMGILANNLNDLQRKKLSYIQVLMITSTMFAIVHFPYLELIVVTFIMALFYTVVFIKKRNIIPLGIFHGILGGLFFYWIMEKDTWALFVRIFQE